MEFTSFGCQLITFEAVGFICNTRFKVLCGSHIHCGLLINSGHAFQGGDHLSSRSRCKLALVLSVLVIVAPALAIESILEWMHLLLTATLAVLSCGICFCLPVICASRPVPEQVFEVLYIACCRSTALSLLAISYTICRSRSGTRCSPGAWCHSCSPRKAWLTSLSRSTVRHSFYYI